VTAGVSMPNPEYEFEVALSFAGENRDYVREVRDKLVARSRRVFYDEDRLAEMWGEELPEYFQRIFRDRSQYAGKSCFDGRSEGPGRIQRRDRAAVSGLTGGPT
jgi:hypothetical protein